MTLSDSSVWIDYLNGRETAQTDILDGMLGVQQLVIGDLILAEVLQGVESTKEFVRVKDLMTSLRVVHLGGEALAVQAAINFRKLREIGITVRKTIDTLIATWCIENGVLLLHSDKDFEPFAKHLGLQVTPLIH